MELTAGICDQGERHHFRFGKCVKCGLGEGLFVRDNPQLGSVSPIKLSRAPSAPVLHDSPPSLREVMERLSVPEFVPQREREAVLPSARKLEGEQWMRCPTCEHKWLDKYRKDECPRCLSTLSWGLEMQKKAAERHAVSSGRRQPGEVSTIKQRPSSAMEASAGNCSKGGAHKFRFGRCNKCGLEEGEFARRGYT